MNQPSVQFLYNEKKNNIGCSFIGKWCWKFIRASFRIVPFFLPYRLSSFLSYFLFSRWLVFVASNIYPSLSEHSFKSSDQYSNIQVHCNLRRHDGGLAFLACFWNAGAVLRYRNRSNLFSRPFFPSPRISLSGEIGRGPLYIRRKIVYTGEAKKNNKTKNKPELRT